MSHTTCVAPAETRDYVRPNATPSPDVLSFRAHSLVWVNQQQFLSPATSSGDLQKLPPTDGRCPLQMLFCSAINDNYACCAQRSIDDQMATYRVFVRDITMSLVHVHMSRRGCYIALLFCSSVSEPPPPRRCLSAFRSSAAPIVPKRIAKT